MRATRAAGAAIAGAAGLAVAGCGRLDELTYEPATTAEQWCEQRPCFDVGTTTLNEPLGTVLVFLLAALWIAAGLYLCAAAIWCWPRLAGRPADSVNSSS